MRNVSAILVGSVALVLTACDAKPQSGSNTAEDYAERINGRVKSDQASLPSSAPTIAAPLPVAATEIAPGTETEPARSICADDLMEDFFGKQADDAIRAAVMEAAAGTAQEVRFVMPDSGTVQPDPTNPRLNIMIDNLGIIRDARCG